MAHQIDSAQPEKLVERFEQLVWALRIAEEAVLEQVRAGESIDDDRRAASADSP